jgi:ATP-dependent DNA ligase
LKTKCFTEGGTARDRKTKAPLALLARADQPGLSYAGSAFIALSGSERDELNARLEMNRIERCALPKLRFPDAQWVKPQLIARVRHLATTKHLRHCLRTSNDPDRTSQATQPGPTTEESRCTR